MTHTLGPPAARRALLRRRASRPRRAPRSGGTWRPQGFTQLVGRTSAELDLRDRDATFAFFAAERPASTSSWPRPRSAGSWPTRPTRPTSCPTTCASRSTSSTPRTQHGVERLLFLGSSCIYPKLAPQPIREDALLTGPLEPTNDAYAIAKIAGMLQVQALRRQHGASFISAMPTNLYGPGRQLRPADLARAAGHDPPLPRGQGVRRARGDPVGQRHPAAGVPARRRPGPRRACSCSSTTTTRRRSTSASGEDLTDPRAGRD